MIGGDHHRGDPLNIPVFDPKIRFHTSQFALKFRKPAR